MRKETKNKSTKNCKLNNIYLLKNTKKKKKRERPLNLILLVHTEPPGTKNKYIFNTN